MRFFGVFAVVGGILGGACTQDTSAQIKDALEETIKDKLKKEEVDAPGAAVAQPELLANKLGLYIECARATDAAVRERQRLYLARVDEGGIPRTKEPREELGPIPEQGVERCMKARKEGPHLQPPQADLEAKTAAYVDALTAYRERLAAALASIDALATHRGQPDPATRERLSAERSALVSAYDAWVAAAEGLGIEIAASQERVDTAVLERIERRSGRGLEYQSRAFVMRSRPLIQCLGEGPTSACEAAYFTLEEAHGELHAYLEAHPDEGARVFWFDHFITSADEYFTAARALLGRIRGGDAGRAEVDKVLAEFGDLVRDASNLRFDRLGQRGEGAAAEGAGDSGGAAAAAESAGE